MVIKLLGGVNCWRLGWEIICIGGGNALNIFSTGAFRGKKTEPTVYCDCAGSGYGSGSGIWLNILAGCFFISSSRVKMGTFSEFLFLFKKGFYLIWIFLFNSLLLESIFYFGGSTTSFFARV